jgi:spermidine/putrescine transport system substrate-binding protein
MCVPTGSRNPELAEAYINFMLSEEVAIANAEYICYASPNKLVTQNADYAASMQEVHPDAMEILYGFEGIDVEAYSNLPDEQLTLLNTLWEDLQIESAIGGTIIGLAVAILAILAALAVFFWVRRRKRRAIVANLWNE